MTDNQTPASQTALYEDLFVQLGLANLPEEKKAQLAQKISEDVEERTTLRILNMLSDEDKLLFDACTTPADFEEFWKATKIDTTAIAMEEALALREELIRDSSYIAAKLSQ